MSYPTIPDINPTICLTKEDSLNLLLASIAHEEMSISKLMDAERCKLMSVVNDYKCRRYDRQAIQDILAVNKSVDDNMKNMVKLQLLLHYKMGDVKELMSHRHTCTKSCTTTCTHTHTCSRTSSCTNTHTVTCTKAPCPDTANAINTRKICFKNKPGGNRMQCAVLAAALGIICTCKIARR